MSEFRSMNLFLDPNNPSPKVNDGLPVDDVYGIPKGRMFSIRDVVDILHLSGLSVRCIDSGDGDFVELMFWESHKTTGQNDPCDLSIQLVKTGGVWEKRIHTKGMR